MYLQDEHKTGTGSQLNLVFFKEAVIHFVRLSRVLSKPGGHSVLVSTGRHTGRRTLVRLTAFVMQYRVSSPLPFNRQVK